MNNREMLVKRCISQQYNYLVGGLVNTLLDNGVNSDIYKEAYAMLTNKEQIINTVYREVVSTEVMSLGIYSVNVKKDIRFLGKNKIISIITDYVNKRLPEDIKDVEQK